MLILLTKQNGDEEENNIDDEEVKIDDEEDEINERCLCLICFEKQRVIVFVPCGHITCSLDCNDCPVCRAVIDKKIKFYVP